MNRAVVIYNAVMEVHLMKSFLNCFFFFDSMMVTVEVFSLEAKKNSAYSEHQMNVNTHIFLIFYFLCF